MTSPLNRTGSKIAWQNWAVYVGPLAVYMLLAAMIIAVWERIEVQLIANQSPEVALTIAVVRLVSILALVMWGFPKVKQDFPIHVSPVAVAVGILGAGIWIALCRLNLESKLLATIGFSPDLFGSRQAINPWDLFDSSSERNLFLVNRFSLLIVAVPLAEELFLRGFLLRYFTDPDWPEVTLDRIGRSAIGTTAVYGAMTHPAEWISAAIWFSLVTILMLRTRRFWDCVVAHAVTNGILGVYIIWAQDWRLW